MIPQAEVKKYGGKAAILNYIRAALPDMQIPPYVVKQHGQSLRSVMRDFSTMAKPVIVRSSSPHEYADFEGIFKSVKGVETKDRLEKAVKDVEDSATSARALAYAKQHGYTIDGEMHVIVQEQHPVRYASTMMRHPNNPNLVFIHMSSGPDEDRNHSRIALNDKACRKANIDGIYDRGITVSEANHLAAQYRMIESLDIMEGYALFVEFGCPPFELYQVRPFKRKQTANFEVPREYSDTHLHTKFCFGITPKEGVVMPLAKSTSCMNFYCEIKRFHEKFSAAMYSDDTESLGIENMDDFDRLVMHCSMTGAGRVPYYGSPWRLGFENIGSDRLATWHGEIEQALGGHSYCLMIDSAHKELYDVDLTVPGMRGLVIGETTNFLDHNLMRLFKQADYVIGEPLLANEFFATARCFEDSVRITSNGKEAAVELLKG